jgi:3',5'-cyclic AMP phosphodiesterase CpdA
MRIHYLSDLHLESQAWSRALPHGDLLVIAGDLGHARCFTAPDTDRYAAAQRDRMARFAETAVAQFAHVVLVAGNHDHYDGVFDDTVALFARHLPGVTVLDDDALEIGDVRLFGTTLWSDFEGGDADAMKRAAKGCGEFFFVKRRVAGEKDETLARFRPPDALAAHRKARAALEAFLAQPTQRKTVVVSHHAPSLKGLNPLHAGNGLDGAYATPLDALIEASGIHTWIHGHTHIRRTYRIGDTTVRANCRGFDGKDPAARTFAPDLFFEI